MVYVYISLVEEIGSMIYTWKCTQCDFHQEVTRPMSEHDRRPDAEYEEEGSCGCGANRWVRVYTPPAIMSAAYPDGYKRKGFTELKEAAKLEKERAVARTDSQRNEITKEITKMGVKPGSNGSI